MKHSQSLLAEYHLYKLSTLFIKEKKYINLKNGIVSKERLSTYHLELGYSFWLSWQEHLTEPQFFFHIPIIGNRNMRNLQMIIM